MALKKMKTMLLKPHYIVLSGLSLILVGIVVWYFFFSGRRSGFEGFADATTTTTVNKKEQAFLKGKPYVAKAMNKIKAEYDMVDGDKKQKFLTDVITFLQNNDDSTALSKQTNPVKNALNEIQQIVSKIDGDSKKQKFTENLVQAIKMSDMCNVNGNSRC